MNSFKYKILIRCDAANILGIGTGHVYRCITIAQLIKKKYKLKHQDIAFVIKTKNKFKQGLSILKSYKFKIIQIENHMLKANSMDEAKYLTQNSSNLLIIDRLGSTNIGFIKKIKNSFNKKIIIDDFSDNRKHFDLSLNPLTHNVKKVKNSNIGFNYLISPSINSKKSYKKINEKNILIFLGGFDSRNFTIKIVKILNLIPFKLNIFIHNSFIKKIKKKISKNKIIFFDSKKYTKILNKVNIVVNAGGIGLFDSIYYNKKIICTPQYKKQEINAKKTPIKKVINLIKMNDKNYVKKFYSIFLKIYKSDNDHLKIKKLQNKVINSKKFKKTMRLIFNLYEKSKY